MTRDSEEIVAQELVYGFRNDVFNDKFTRACIRAYQRGVRDKVVIEAIRNPVRKAKFREELGLDAPFRKPRLGRNQLLLGEVDGTSVGIKRALLRAHLVCTANTGSGKTSFYRYLLLQLAPYVKGLWLSDLYKKDLRDLRPLFAERGRDLIVASPRSLKINLLQAECEPRTHLAMAIDVLTRALDMPPRALSIVRAQCHQLYVEFGIYQGKRDCWPTLFDLYERVRANTKLNAQAREAILDKLGSLLVSLTPAVAANRYSWRPCSDLAKFAICFEMLSAGEHVKQLLLSYLMFSVLYERIEEGRSNAELDHIISFEDSQRFFAGGSSASGEVSPVTEILSVIRSMGVSIWGNFQTMDGIQSGLLANFATKVMGRLGVFSDYQSLGRDMGMNARQIEWAKTNLRPGKFIVQLSEGPREPFAVDVPLIAAPAVVSDADVASSMTALDSLRTIPATEFGKWEPNHIIEIIGGSACTQPSTTCDASLSETEYRFLEAVVANPGQRSSAYSKLAAMGAKKAVAARRLLVANGWVIEREVATGQRGRNAILLEPAKKAKALFAGEGEAA